MKMTNMKSGYGFRPSDEELIGHLQNRTLLGCDCLVQDITDLEVDICMWEPWDLPGLTKVTSSDQAWYFFYPVTYKYLKCKSKKMNQLDGKRKLINRATKEGKWKPSGNPVKVKASGSNREIGIKRHLYFFKDEVDDKNNKTKAKHKNSYQNKTPWVLYVYELTGVDPKQNKYFLGKLMKQSEPTNISYTKGETSQQLPSSYLGNHVPTPEVQLGSNEPLLEMEISNGYDWDQNQSGIREQVTVDNCETYPEERCNPLNLVDDANYVAYDAIQQVQLVETEVSNGYNWTQNLSRISKQATVNNYETYTVDNYETYSEERCNPLNFVDDANYVAYDAIQQVQLEFGEPLVETEVSNGYDWTQNLSSISEQVTVDNYETYPEERCNPVNFVNVADDAIQQYLRVDHREERSNQHNVIAGNQGFDLPSNFNDYPIADDLFNDLCGSGIYLDELFGAQEAPNNYLGVQNQYSTDQRDADELRNSNFIHSGIGYPVETSKAAAAEIGGSNLPSSHIGESFNKRSRMEHQGPSVNMETKVAQPHAKKSRF